MTLRPTYCNMMNDPLTLAVATDTSAAAVNLRIGTHALPGADPCYIPIGYLKAGTTIRTEAWGTFTNASTTPTLIFGIQFASTVLGATAAVAETSVASTLLPWHIWATTQVRSSLTNTAVVTSTMGYCMRGTSVSAVTFDPIPAVSFVTVNVDNTVASTEWSVFGTMSASSASNIVNLHGMVIEEVTQI